MMPFTKVAIFMPSSKFEPTIWSHDTGHIGIHGGVDLCTGGQSYDDVIAKTKISHINGLPYFLNNGAPCACGAPLKHATVQKEFNHKFKRHLFMNMFFNLSVFPLQIQFVVKHLKNYKAISL